VIGPRISEVTVSSVLLSIISHDRSVVKSWPGLAPRSSRWSGCSPCTPSWALASKPCGHSAAAQPGRSFGHLLVGLIDLAAGMVALAWPGSTALMLVLIVASWAIIAGLAEIAAAFRGGAATGTRALFIVGGLVSVAFGAVLLAHPGVGAFTPGAAVRPVQPGLRGSGSRAGHRAAAYRERPACGRAKPSSGQFHVRPRAQHCGVAVGRLARGGAGYPLATAASRRWQPHRCRSPICFRPGGSRACRDDHEPERRES